MYRQTVIPTSGWAGVRISAGVFISHSRRFLSLLPSPKVRVGNNRRGSTNTRNIAEIYARYNYIDACLYRCGEGTTRVTTACPEGLHYGGA